MPGSFTTGTKQSWTNRSSLKTFILKTLKPRTKERMDNLEAVILVCVVAAIAVGWCVYEHRRVRAEKRRLQIELECEMDRAFAHSGWAVNSEAPFRSQN